MKLKNLITPLFMPIVLFILTGKWKVSDAVDTLFKGQQESKTLQRIFHEAYGDEWSEEVDQCGYVTLTDLRHVAEYVAIKPGQTIVDLACGRGGPGMWVARETKGKLIGIDLSALAVKYAALRAGNFGLQGRAQFRQGDFSSTGLSDECCDCVICIDALQLALDIPATLNEVRRILKPGACFVFTTWESTGKFLNITYSLMPKDYRPLLKKAGFEVEVYDEPHGWTQANQAVYDLILEREEELIKDMGKDSAIIWIKEARRLSGKLEGERRIICAARKV